ncbi:MAG TPA: ABC transporter permease [Ktedonobacterales bacterium]|nr:ABC transporter permease [Ktedonobacterales bacterium]
MQPIFTLTLRALARNRRSLAVIALLCVPVLLALIYVASEGKSGGESFVIQLFVQLVLPILLPLTALIFATSALGGEVEDRTLVYLILRPVSRLTVIAAKLLASAVITTILVEISLAATYLIGTQGDGTAQNFGAILLAGLVGCLAYSSLFLLVGLWLPRRGLLVGFLYVLLWEGILSQLSTGLAAFSVRRYIEGALNANLSASALTSSISVDISGSASLIVLALVLVGGILISTWKLQQMELP